MKTSLITIALLALVTPSFGNVLTCYFGSWSIYRVGNGRFTPEDIDPKLCTHIMYAFVGINARGDVVILDPWNDLADGLNSFKRVQALKEISPNTKIMVSIGGWSQGSVNFSTVVSNAAIRATFVRNAVAFLIEYGFEGLDVDWEYPAQNGGASTDVENFVLLLRELNEAFQDHGFVLTTAVAAIESSASQSYDIPRISQYVSYINIMAFDIHGTSSSTIGINAPLYPASYETTAYERQLNVNASITYWINSGADPSKLVLGIPAYAKTFTLANVNNNTPGSNFIAAGSPGPYTSDAGILGYNELCEKQLSGDWTTVWFEEQQVPYSYSGNQWAGYDDVRSVEVKTNFAIDNGLAGVMFWAVDLDDFKSVCSDVKFPLITAAHNILFPISDSPATEATTTSTTIQASTTEAPDVIDDIESSTAHQEEPPAVATGVTVPEVTTTSSTTGSPNTTIAATTVTSSTVSSTTASSDYVTSSVICTGQSYIKNKDDCSKFWQCVPLGQGAYIGYQFICPAGLWFDETLNVCNWPWAVECSV